MMSPELAAALRTIHDLATGNQAQPIGFQNTLNAQAQAITELQQRILKSETIHSPPIEALRVILVIAAAGCSEGQAPKNISAH